VRAGAEQRFHQIGACLQHVLAVVEDQEQVTRTKRLEERLGHLLRTGGVDRQRGGNSLRDERRVGERCEFDEPDAMRIGPEQLIGDAQSEARFAAPAGAGQRQQAGTRLNAAHGRDLLFPSDKAGEMDRQVGDRRRRSSLWRVNRRRGRGFRRRRGGGRAATPARLGE
jgi:hypothetical protein